MSSPSDPLQFQPIWEVVLERLRADVLSGQLPAGHKFVESDIAERFGVSRGPVREALRELAREGLVIDLPRRGTVVCTITQADLMEVYAVREALEVQAVRDGIAIATDSELAEVKRAHDVMADAWAGKDWNFALNAHKDFHRQISLLAGNKRLTNVQDMMAHQTMLLLVTASETNRGLMDPPLEEIHLAMSDAIQSRDTKAAERAVRHHYRYTRARLLPSLEDVEA